MDEKIEQLLNKHDWPKFILALTAYTISVCRWKHYRLPPGIEAEDIVMQAIEKVYEGKRKWDPERDPDLLKYLKSVVRSLINNELGLAASGTLSLDSISADDPAPQYDPDDELYYKQVNQEIAAQMRGDPVCALIFKGFKDGMTLKEISDEFMVDIEEIRKGRRRLLTIAVRVTKQLSKGS
jgi:RNA polymerase sigma factor (sigma-70 family)